MKRLLLASHGIGALPELAGRDVAGMRFGFVPTAAGPEAEERPFVQADRRQLAALGCEVSTLDLAAASPDEVVDALRHFDGVFLTGGNAYLLLWHARRSGFAELAPRRVERGKLLYVGTSAGGLLAGPDVEPAAAPENRAAVPALESTVALGLVDLTILPHDQDPERAARHDELVATHPDRRFVRLTDDRAVLVRGSEIEVVDSPALA
jgi:dipeptidase E